MAFLSHASCTSMVSKKTSSCRKKKNQASSVLVFVNINKTGWNSYLLCMSLAQVSYSTFFVFFVARILLPLCLLLCYTEVMMTQQNVMQCHAKRFSLKYRRHDEARYGCSRPLTPLMITNIITQYYRYEDTYKYITGDHTVTSVTRLCVLSFVVKDYRLLNERLQWNISSYTWKFIEAVV